jgi:hypothetical protein
MKRIILAACAVSISFPAFAISRYNIAGLSCAQVQAILERDGEAILRYPSSRNPNIILYDIYYALNGKNDNTGTAGSVTVPTSDNPNCPVGAISPIDSDNFDFFSTTTPDNSGSPEPGEPQMPETPMKPDNPEEEEDRYEQEYEPA